LWIAFPNVNRIQRVSTATENQNQEEQDDQDEEKMIRNELMNISNKLQENVLPKHSAELQEEVQQVTLPFWEKIVLLWSAPISKFWINLTFYIIYLSLFGVAVLWPSCGNLYVDTILWFWTGMIIIKKFKLLNFRNKNKLKLKNNKKFTALICGETARRTYIKYIMGSNFPIKSSCFEIILMVIFLILFLFIRILDTWHFDVLTSKSILCLGLIYFYYRSVFVYLPISPTLGPMLVKMIYMVRIDFLTFLRMFIVFMAAGGITINAIIYPYYPLNSELMKRVFLRAFFGLFVTGWLFRSNIQVHFYLLL